MKTQTKRETALKLVLYFLMGAMFTMVYGQQPSKQTMPSARDVVVGVKPAQPMLQQENSGGQPIRTGFEGTPGNAFFNPNWQEGLVIMKDGNLIEIENLRYNLLTQQMQFIKNSDTLAIANSDEISMIRIADKVFIYVDFVCSGLLSKGYLEMVEDGNCRLLRRWAATYRYLDPVTGEETIYRNQTCLIQFSGEMAKDLPSNTNEFLRMFGDHSQSIKQMMKNEKLRIRNPNDLRMMVAYYNQISAE